MFAYLPANPALQQKHNLRHEADTMELPLSGVSSPDVTEPADGSGPSRPKKRLQVRHACLSCRTDKVKCSGVHPMCSRCKTRSLDCSYDVPLENMTKMQHLRSKITEQERRLVHIGQIFDILQNGTDSEAAEALARLRMGEKMEEVVNSMRLRTSPTRGSKSPETMVSA
ncbi:uncharacterized protein RCC_10031 [Ramularia collo-cygni]|uniref:Zn(2)-C6 fungal-type domain-containing protein n=1 Tax=Ramularia collo-cygni TaxID=112498 RepID=A0A2D3VBF9_9PEZI|nr:uncharacterized protein RCC_10031 [Ramularia collo-cygni]CZT24310.1 uncharacterized protein RCC_10031 [Ramularia collo-cygni]